MSDRLPSREGYYKYLPLDGGGKPLRRRGRYVKPTDWRVHSLQPFVELLAKDRGPSPYPLPWMEGCPQYLPLDGGGRLSRGEAGGGEA